MPPFSRKRVHLWHEGVPGWHRRGNRWEVVTFLANPGDRRSWPAIASSVSPVCYCPDSGWQFACIHRHHRVPGGLDLSLSCWRVIRCGA
jgi:hypothetical protein